MGSNSEQRQLATNDCHRRVAGQGAIGQTSRYDRRRRGGCLVSQGPQAGRGGRQRQRCRHWLSCRLWPGRVRSRQAAPRVAPGKPIHAADAAAVGRRILIPCRGPPCTRRRACASTDRLGRSRYCRAVGKSNCRRDACTPRRPYQRLARPRSCRREAAVSRNNRSGRCHTAFGTTAVHCCHSKATKRDPPASRSVWTRDTRAGEVALCSTDSILDLLRFRYIILYSS